MKSIFSDAIYSIKSLRLKLKEVLDGNEAVSFEDKIAYRALDSVYECLDNAEFKIGHYSKPCVEGYLVQMASGKYELIDERGSQVTYFSCGDLIECFIDVSGEWLWLAGRIEYSHNDDKYGYYFYNSEANHPLISNGMRARVRGNYE